MPRVFVVLLLLISGFAQADDFSAVETKLKAAMAADVRSEAEVERDRNRSRLRRWSFSACVMT